MDEGIREFADVDVAETVPAAAPSWRERHESRIRLVRLYARTFARNGSAMFGLGPWCCCS